MLKKKKKLIKKKISKKKFLSAMYRIIIIVTLDQFVSKGGEKKKMYGSSGPDANAFSLYSTSNSITYSNKKRVDGSRNTHTSSMKTAFTSNLPPFPQNEQFGKNDVSFATTLVLKPRKFSTHEVVAEAERSKYSPHRYITGFKCNSAKQLKIHHPEDGIHEGRGIKKRNHPSSPQTTGRRKFVGGAALNGTCAGIYEAMARQPMVSESHEASASLRERPLPDACYSHGDDGGRQRSSGWVLYPQSVLPSAKLNKAQQKRLQKSSPVEHNLYMQKRLDTTTSASVFSPPPVQERPVGSILPQVVSAVGSDVQKNVWATLRSVSKRRVKSGWACNNEGAPDGAEPRHLPSTFQTSYQKSFINKSKLPAAVAPPGLTSYASRASNPLQTKQYEHVSLLGSQSPAAVSTTLNLRE